MSTQTERLLDLLREFGERGVTPLDALDRIGSFRLGARIYDLKAQGYTIESHRVKMASGSIVARYVLRESSVPPIDHPVFHVTKQGAAKMAQALCDFAAEIPAERIEPNGQARLW